MNNNTLKNKIKNQFRSYLFDYMLADVDRVNVAARDLVDIVFEVIKINPNTQIESIEI